MEQQRFANKWLFPWHQMNMEGRSFTVEDFRGGHISYGGDTFEGQPQTIYWQAIERYLKAEIHKCFRRWNTETVTYTTTSRRSSLDGTERILGIFVASIVRNAVDTDRRLRGRGYPPNDTPIDSSRTHTSANVEILRLKTAHEALMATELTTETLTVWGRIWSAIGLKPGMFGLSLDVKELFKNKK